MRSVYAGEKVENRRRKSPPQDKPLPAYREGLFVLVIDDLDEPEPRSGYYRLGPGVSANEDIISDAIAAYEGYGLVAQEI